MLIILFSAQLFFLTLFKQHLFHAVLCSFLRLNALPVLTPSGKRARQPVFSTKTRYGVIDAKNARHLKFLFAIILSKYKE